MALSDATLPPRPPLRYEPLDVGPPVPPQLSRPTCQLCGAGPVAPVTLRQVTGLVLAFRIRTWRHTLCRDCGRATARTIQNRTAIRGWWGLVAPIANVVVLVLNAVALAKLGRLGPPRDGIRPPLHPGHGVLLRSGALLTLALVGVVTFAVLTYDGHDLVAVGHVLPPR
jgi:hypothetical protein